MWWLFLIAGLLLVIVAISAIWSGRVGQAANAGLASGIAGLIIGAIIGAILSLFAIFSMGFTGLLATVALGLIGALIGFALGFILGFIFNAFPPQVANWIARIFGIAVVIIILLGLGYLIWYSYSVGSVPEYLKFASPLVDSSSNALKELGKFKYCFIADSRCPFFVQWDNPNVQNSEEKLRIDVSFSDKKISQDDNLNLLVSLSVSNPELSELRVIPKCYLGKNKSKELEIESMGAYASGDKFVFPSTLSGQELHTNLRCIGHVDEASGKNIFSEIAVLILERPVSVKAVWPVYVGEEPAKGLIKSEMEFNAPYTIALASHNDMPFKEGKEYDFSIVLKRQEEKVKLKQLNFINVKFSEGIMVSCEGFEGNDYEFELRDFKYEALKNISQYDSEQEKFTWACKLYVAKAPKNAVLSPIELDAEYIIYSDYETRVIKSP